ncbi:uncharacterized protein C19orf44-like [Mizuhopecten yessoensis]|uniref:Uncharacterized protein C19orf44 n=1 Tax=Mizuhopecten yessoensis TaxID=6573 RepID=A0A210PEA1_MIZYE|nr:uncharacterized protein C19orf44-like [Mizuhopecten yessoensis]OWF34810.1 Uncharacterized protein C19orf44 [Mizuhopecten yessoensis]
MKRSNALLQKVSSQLKGDIIKKPTEEDDLEAYIKSLSQKTAQHKKSVNFEDIGDISISSELDTNSSTQHKKNVPTVGSKFLKKNTGQKTAPAPQSKFLKKPQTSAASPIPTVSSQPRPGTSRGALQQQAKGPVYGQPRPGTQKSSSLDKAAALTQKIAGRQTFANTKNVFTLETDSEDTCTLTTPRASNPTPGKRQNNRVLSPSPRSVSSDSVKIGRDGGKFMKKKQPAPAEEKSAPHRKPEPSGRKSPVPKAKQAGEGQRKSASPFLLKSSQRYSTDVVLSSEEESLAEFITGLDADSSEDGKIREYMKRIKSNDKLKTRVPSPPPRRTPSPDAKPPTAIRRTPSPQNQRRSPSPKFHRRSPSPVFRRSRSSDDSALSDSLQSEVIEERDESDAQSISSEDGFKFNLMDANSFEPVVFETKSRKTTKSPVQKKSAKSPVERRSRETMKTASKPRKELEKKPKKEKKNDLFSSFGLHTVEELLGVGDISEVRDISEASEIRTESSQSEIRTEKDEPFVFGQRTKPEPESEIEIVSEIKTRDYSTQRKDSYSEDFEPSISERIGMSSKSHRLKSGSEIRTRYSSEGTADDYTEEFNSDTDSIATISRTSAGPPSEMTISDSYTDQSASYSYTAEKRKPKTGHVKMKSVEVQTAEPGLTFSWDSRYSGMAMPGPALGMGFVDPTPIATHVVSPETLETMTAYSPSMIALHDMLRQQLELTRDFLKSQRYMYQCMMSSVDQRHTYTTLEDTRKYIRKNRRKRLTFKEALRMVDAEMER